MILGSENLEIRVLWSRIARPFPLEEPGYFLVVDIARKWLVEYGWQGWVSWKGFFEGDGTRGMRPGGHG